jgi:hypothetical protein
MILLDKKSANKKVTPIKILITISAKMMRMEQSQETRIASNIFEPLNVWRTTMLPWKRKSTQGSS